MATENLKLIEPDESMLEELAEFLAEYGDASRNVEGMWWVAEGGPEETVRRCRECAQGIGLPEGFVPSTTYLLVREDGTILGAINLRHWLNEALRNYGGHIGYSVRPSARGQGYATRMLALGLQKAREREIDRVLITCKKSNPASARVIEKNGGVLEAEKTALLEGKPIAFLFYWIELETDSDSRRHER